MPWSSASSTPTMSTRVVALSEVLDLELQKAARARGLPKRADFERWVEAVLKGRRKRAGLVIRIVGRREGAELNRRYREKKGPTNVLSFPWEAPPGASSDLLGDLVICAPVVRREAKEQGKEARAHWAHLVVHGVLHLLGYDHKVEGEARAMEALETRILADLGFADPYAEADVC